jgi:hypothetical protein
MGTNSVARIVPQILRGRTIHLRPDWRRDLNHVLASKGRSFVDSPPVFDQQAPLFEAAHGAETLIPTTTKPFDVLAEGLLSEISRGDRTAIELFVVGIRGWDGHLRGQVNNGSPFSE